MTYIVRQWRTVGHELPAAHLVGEAQKTRVDSKRVDAGKIVAAHLFGEFRESETESLPIAHVPLILTGTIALPDPQAGFAIVGNNASSTRLLQVGDRIGDARIHSVYNDHIVLERGGKLETLPLPKQWQIGFAG
jgi:type II secretory pathway component PulC